MTPTGLCRWSLRLREGEWHWHLGQIRREVGVDVLGVDGVCAPWYRSATLRERSLTLRARLRRSCARLGTLRARLRTLRAALATLRARLGTLCAGLATLRAGLRTLCAGLGTLRAALATLRAGSRTLRAALVTLRAGLRTCCAALATLRPALRRPSEASPASRRLPHRNKSRQMAWLTMKSYREQH